MKFYGKTDIGRRRAANEDNFGIYRIADNASLLLVCDGMGGEAGGALASSLALKSFYDDIVYQTTDNIVAGKLVLDDPEADVPMLLDSAIAAANFEVWQKAQDVPGLRGMGTTLIGLFIMTDPLRVFSVNVGDSRLYLSAPDGIRQLSKDHSYIQHLIDTGVITEEQAESRTDRNIITRAVGISVQIQPDIKPIAADPGDTLLLCSDGLWGMLTGDDIHGILERRGTSLEKKIDRLVMLANDAGGDDNITAVAAEL